MPTWTISYEGSSGAQCTIIGIKRWDEANAVVCEAMRAMAKSIKVESIEDAPMLAPAGPSESWTLLTDTISEAYPNWQRNHGPGVEGLMKAVKYLGRTRAKGST